MAAARHYLYLGASSFKIGTCDFDAIARALDRCRSEGGSP